MIKDWGLSKGVLFHNWTQQRKHENKDFEGLLLAPYLHHQVTSPYKVLWVDIKNKALGNFHLGPVVKVTFQCRGHRVWSWLGNKIPQATWYGHNNNIKGMRKKDEHFLQPKMLTTDSFMDQTNK